MTRPERHRIERQVFDLVVAHAAQAPALQAALARSFRERALAQLQAVFDGAARGRGLLRVERLEIDLGTLRGRDWEEQLRLRLTRELARQLAVLGAHGVAFAAADAAAAAEGGAAVAPPSGPLQQLLFFLAHGRLPWWATPVEPGWIEALPAALDAADWRALRSALVAHSVARQRFVHSAGDDVLQHAVAQWCGLPHAADALRRLMPPALHAKALAAWRREAWVMVLQWALAQDTQSRSGPVLAADLLALRRALFAAPPSAADAAPPAPGAGAVAEPRLQASVAELPQPWRAWMAACASTQHSGSAKPRPVLATPAPKQPGEAPAIALARPMPLRPAPAASRLAEAANDSPGAPPDSEAIYLPGAGTLLVHPFLPQLFRESGLLEARGFCDLAARDRAVQMLGLLAFGREGVPEYELLLPKLLCGCAFEEPVDPVPLEDTERERCAALLQSLLRHWTALRSSSPEWLREQFFLREGKLESVDGGVRLTVERRAQDVLLARLPWGVGVIALPWLRQRIFVHWLD